MVKLLVLVFLEMLIKQFSKVPGSKIRSLAYLSSVNRVLLSAKVDLESRFGRTGATTVVVSTKE